MLRVSKIVTTVFHFNLDTWISTELIHQIGVTFCDAKAFMSTQ
jgi:hypothetical protein